MERIEEDKEKLKTKKWKSNYLSSGVPLEFEAAKMLVSKGFYVNSDYTYTRRDNESSGIAKDFSVDIDAHGYVPFDPNGNDLYAELVLLVDCKYRIHNTKWLFLPEIDEGKPDASSLSNIIFGRTIRIVNEFSPFLLDKKDCYKFESKLPPCYKGVEIRLDGQVLDAEIKHGIAQLRYAMPRLLTDEIFLNIGSHPEDNYPFMICPILLTTADLYVIRKNISMNEIISAESVSDISDSVPYLILFSDYGPDFENHCSKEFKNLSQLEDNERIRNLEEKFKQSDKEIYEFKYPLKIGNSLAEARRYELSEYFTQFFICNFNNFPDFIDKIKETVVNIMDTRQKI
jgi:hypothetical protein